MFFAKFNPPLIFFFSSTLNSCSDCSRELAARDEYIAGARRGSVERGELYQLDLRVGKDELDEKVLLYLRVADYRDSGEFRAAPSDFNTCRIHQRRLESGSP